MMHNTDIGTLKARDPKYDHDGYPICPVCGTLLLNMGYNPRTRMCGVCGQLIQNYKERLTNHA